MPQKNVVRVNTAKHPCVPVKPTCWTVQADVDDIEQQDNGTWESL